MKLKDLYYGMKIIAIAVTYDMYLILRNEVLPIITRHFSVSLKRKSLDSISEDEFGATKLERELTQQFD